MSDQPLFDVGPATRHMILPNMSLACGLPLLHEQRPPERAEERISVDSWMTTCPDCLAQPISDLCRQMQQRQAVAS